MGTRRPDQGAKGSTGRTASQKKIPSPVGMALRRSSLVSVKPKKELSMTVQPYLFFDGNAEQAIKFYERAIGAKVEMIMHYKECPDTPPPGTVPPGFDN